MPRTSAADLAHGIKGATFPINTRQLAEHARQNRAPQDVIETIKEMPDQEFASVTDVERAFGKVQPAEGRPRKGGPAQEARKGGAHRRKS